MRQKGFEGVGIAHLRLAGEGWSLRTPLAWLELSGTHSLVVSTGNPTGKNLGVEK